jgi:hypothetical protein
MNKGTKSKLSRDLLSSLERYFILKGSNFRIKEVFDSDFDTLVKYATKRESTYKGLYNIYQFIRSTGKERLVYCSYQDYKDNIKEIEKPKETYENKKAIEYILRDLKWDKFRIIDYFPFSGILYITQITEKEKEELKQNNIREKYFSSVSVISKNEDKNLITVKCELKNIFMTEKTKGALTIEILDLM